MIRTEGGTWPRGCSPTGVVVVDRQVPNHVLRVNLVVLDAREVEEPVQILGAPELPVKLWPGQGSPGGQLRARLSPPAENQLTSHGLRASVGYCEPFGDVIKLGEEGRCGDIGQGKWVALPQRLFIRGLVYPNDRGDEGDVLRPSRQQSASSEARAESVRLLPSGWGRPEL
jgi:hypothetical protein